RSTSCADGLPCAALYIVSLSTGLSSGSRLHQTLDKKLQMAARGTRQRPLVDFLRQTLKRDPGLAARSQINHRALALNRLAHGVIERNAADVLQGCVEKALGDLSQFVEQILPFLRGTGHVGQYAKTRQIVIAIEQFDQ